MKFALPLLAAVAGLALPAVAQDSVPAQQAQEKEPKQAKDDEKICKRVALGVDSRRKERVCLTRDEWRELNTLR